MEQLQSLDKTYDKVFKAKYKIIGLMDYNTNSEL